MRNMVKPFFMKCHPDVQTSADAKQVNLEAIQNLNAFLDSAEAKLKPTAKLMNNEKTVFEVDFCVVMEERIKGKKEEIKLGPVKHAVCIAGGFLWLINKLFLPSRAMHARNCELRCLFCSRLPCKKHRDSIDRRQLLATRFELDVLDVYGFFDRKQEVG